MHLRDEDAVGSAGDGSPKAAAYEAPQVRALGSIHELLAMAKSRFIDCALGGKGDDAAGCEP